MGRKAKLYSIPKAAKEVGVSRSRAYQWASSGLLPVIEVETPAGMQLGVTLEDMWRVAKANPKKKLGRPGKSNDE